MSAVRLVLASASPRRAELLRAAGIEFDVMPAHVDEAVKPGEPPETYVCRMAEAKARAIVPKAAGRVVLAADTVVVVDTTILGKPADAEDARRMLGRLSGRAHEVMTAVTLALGPATTSPSDNRVAAGPGDWQLTTHLEVTTVELAAMTDAEIAWYVASGEPAGKAGAYAIQGLGSRFVRRIQGSYSNVVGLPVAVAYDLCTRTGLLIS